MQAAQVGLSNQALVAGSQVVVQPTAEKSRPKGIRLLVALSLVASVVVIGFGVLFIVVATSAVDLGTIFILLGVATFALRYGYSNGKSWGRPAGFGAGTVYVVFGLLLLVDPDLSIQALGATSLAFGTANLYYLLRPATKEYFQG